MCDLVFQEDFAQACISFLRRRCPHLLGVSIEKELPKSVQLPQETVVTMLSCLQSFLRLDILKTYFQHTAINIFIQNHFKG